MVLVFHLNRDFFNFKCILFLFVIILLLHQIHIFESHNETCHTEKDPIDVVYTWVNGSDLDFISSLNSFILKYYNRDFDSSIQRFDNKNELKYSLRSLEKYAPWVNHIYIVTNGQIPSWLNLDNEKISIITHSEIFPDPTDLPTFSSPAIEFHLHRIKGLSRRFIYFNDDIFLNAPTFPEDFYSPNRGYLIYLSWLVPECATDCSWLFVADGHCDLPCLNLDCQMDGGDCYETPVKFRELNYDKILEGLNKSITRNFNGSAPELSETIDQHNRKVLLRDKIYRKRQKRNLGSRPGEVHQLDAYSYSLQHTHRTLNKHYGFSTRKVPSHAPIMIDRFIMNKLQLRFRQEIEDTSRNRIRTTNDLQFAFTYYYFLIHEQITLSLGDFFNEFDTDNSGFWSETEIRTIITRLYDVPLNIQSINHFYLLLLNCSGSTNTIELSVTQQLIENCAVLKDFTKDYRTRNKYKYEIVTDGDKNNVAFKMISSNITQVIDGFDDIRKKQKKFVCLNDNLDVTRRAENEQVKRLMDEFYNGLFPLPSKFELPERFVNKFLHIDKYFEFMEKRHTHIKLFVCGLVLVGALLLRKLMCHCIGRFFF